MGNSSFVSTDCGTINAPFFESEISTEWTNKHLPHIAISNFRRLCETFTNYWLIIEDINKHGDKTRIKTHEIDFCLIYFRMSPKARLSATRRLHYFWSEASAGFTQLRNWFPNDFFFINHCRTTNIQPSFEATVNERIDSNRTFLFASVVAKLF